jgi:hypothetical protein
MDWSRFPEQLPPASGGRSAKFRQAKNGMMQRQPLRSRSGYALVRNFALETHKKNETILPHARRVFALIVADTRLLYLNFEINLLGLYNSGSFPQEGNNGSRLCFRELLD